jgi:hypothetical protein
LPRQFSSITNVPYRCLSKVWEVCGLWCFFFAGYSYCDKL